MALLITSAPAEELISVEEAKRHLRLLTGDHDTELTALIRDARDYCERFTQRTLRTAVTRALKLDDWWCKAYYLPWPPLIDVTGITYYDADEVSQTLATANYHEELSTDGGGRIVWADDADIPNIFDRPDAITITFTTGYASAAVAPAVALRAMKLKLTELWAAGTESEIEAARKACDRLLGLVDWSGYA